MGQKKAEAWRKLSMKMMDGAEGAEAQMLKTMMDGAEAAEAQVRLHRQHSRILIVFSLEDDDS
jgi:hypothetical protein